MRARLRDQHGFFGDVTLEVESPDRTDLPPVVDECPDRINYRLAKRCLYTAPSSGDAATVAVPYHVIRPGGLSCAAEALGGPVTVTFARAGDRSFGVGKLDSGSAVSEDGPEAAQAVCAVENPRGPGQACVAGASRA